MNLTYSETSTFSKQFKKLTKRFRSLPEDLKTAKVAAIELHHIKNIDNQSCFKLQGYENPSCDLYKLKKFACKALKGKGNRAGIRLIYAYHKSERKVVFIEIYYKGIQVRENKTLIKQYIENLEK